MFAITEIIKHLNHKSVLRIFGSKLITWFFGDFPEGLLYFRGDDAFGYSCWPVSTSKPAVLKWMGCHVGNSRLRQKELVNII